MSEEKSFVLVLTLADIVRVKNGLRLWLQGQTSNEIEEKYQGTVNSVESQVAKQDQLTLETTGRN
jgi:hypothetical protein